MTFALTFSHHRLPRERINRLRVLTIHILFGALLGYITLRLLALGVYWYEFRRGTSSYEDFFSFVVAVTAHYTTASLVLSSLMLLLGALIGLAAGLFNLSLLQREMKLMLATQELGTSLKKMIDGGENDRTEFKSTLRWDLAENKINRALETVIVKTMAGLLNNHGGNLLIGIADNGNVVGLAHDYRTLKQQNRDGFAQFISTLVKTHLGADLCPLVYPVFHEIDGQDVCRVMIKRSSRPVYAKQSDGNTAFFLRTGNGTSALNIQEAVAYIGQRWGVR